MSQTNTNREKKIRSILERSSNIDVQTLQRYIDKKLTKEELHEVEKQLLSSDFAAEAIEGFTNADFKVNIAASTTQLNKNIKNYNKERGFYKTDYRVFYASVSFIFIFLFVIFRLVNIDFASTDLAMENKSQPINDSINSQTAIVKNENLALNENKIVLEENENKAERNKDSNESTTKTNTSLAEEKSKEEIQKDFSTSDIWIAKKEKIESGNNSNKVNSDNSQTIATSPIVSAYSQINDDSTTSKNNEQLADDDFNFFSNQNENSKKAPKELLFDAMQSYENKKYTDAILFFDSYLIINPNDAQALYFGGMSYYENYNYKKAIPLLEKFLNQKSSIIYQKNNQNADWYLANSYLQTNQKQKAKIILEKISKSSNKYSNQAKLLLNELK